jgi:hypothetical protein
MTTRMVWAALAGVAVMAGIAQAQEAGPVVIHKEVRAIGGGSGDVMNQLGPVTMDFVGAEMSFGDKPVKGAPYSAEGVTETTQTLADGNRITHKSNASVYRDSAGRTRREETMPTVGPWAAGGDASKMIFIQDPVAGTGYHLDPQMRVAHKMPMGKGTFFFNQTGAVGGSMASGQKNATFHMVAPPPGVAEASGATGAVAALALPGPRIEVQGKADVKTESLGKQTIEGIEAEGTRSTVILAAGSIGNELPISSVTERWYSAELQTVVMSKRSDPRFGETVYRLTNIQRGEQPASLFEVPSDYTVSENELPPLMKKMTVKPAEEDK